MLRYQEWLRIAMLYENLNNFEYERFKKGELLSFFMTPEDYADEREIYIPMAFALSKGQFYGLPFVDLEQLLIYAFTTDESWKEYVEKNKADFGKLEDVSVYQNIDRDLYKEDGSVALTGAAQRANNTADGTTGTKEAQMDTFSKIAAISWAATAGCALVTLGSMVARHILVNSDTILKYEEGLEYVFEDQDTYGVFITGKGADANAFNSARFAVKLSRIFMVVTLAVAVFSAVMTIIDLCRDKSIEQLPIPNYLVDNYTDADGGSYSLNYKAVECNRMDYFGADYKKQKGDCNFIVQEKSAAPTGYEGVVHLIGEKGAINVVSPAFKDYSTFSTVWQNITGDYTKFIFCKLSNDTKTYDEAAGNMTATAMSGGMIAIIGLGGLALGAALGAIITVLINKKKKETA